MSQADATRPTKRFFIFLTFCLLQPALFHLPTAFIGDIPSKVALSLRTDQYTQDLLLHGHHHLSSSFLHWFHF